MTALPPPLRPLAQFIRVADEFEQREPAVAYWCRLHALQLGMRLDQSPTGRAVLGQHMDKLESMKREHGSDGVFSQQLQALAYVESVALNVFRWADNEDRTGKATRAVVKAFYTCSVLLDVCLAMEDGGADSGDSELRQRATYAKWRATYINQCIKEGRQPEPPQIAGESDVGLPTPGLPHDPSTAPTCTLGFAGPSTSTSGGANETSPLPQMPSFSYSGGVRDTPSSVGAAATPPSGSTGGTVSGGNAAVSPSTGTASGTSSSQQLPFDLVTKAQRCCKHAACALDYGDVGTAIGNLETALSLLRSKTVAD